MAPPIATKVGTLEPWQLRVIDQVFDLCSPGLEIPDIRSLCAPFLRRLHEITGETVMLSIAVGHNSVVVDGIEGRGPLLSRVTHGRPIPLHAAPGRGRFSHSVLTKRFTVTSNHGRHWRALHRRQLSIRTLCGRRSGWYASEAMPWDTETISAASPVLRLPVFDANGTCPGRRLGRWSGGPVP